MIEFRFEISRSAEKAYSSISLDEAKTIFSIQDTNTLKKFIENEQKNATEKGIQWKVDGNTLYFIPVRYFDNFNFKVDAGNNSLAFANGIPDVLKYANELEKIV